MGGYNFYTYGPPGEPSPEPPEALVKLADVIPVAPVPHLPGPGTAGGAGESVEPETDPNTVWSYKKPAETKEERKAEDKAKEFTPGFDFSEKIADHEGKERKVELSPSGLYVFDKKEKFEYKTPPVQSVQAAQAVHGVWVGVKRQFSTGRVLTPAASRPSDFKTVKIRGLKAVLELTKKTK